MHHGPFTSPALLQNPHSGRLLVCHTLSRSSGLVPLILSADGGAVFSSNTGLMGMLGAATEIPISHELMLRPSVTYDAVWTSLPGVASSNGNAIYQNPVSSSSMLSTAIGFNVSLIFRP